jgi:hypothetical protein
VNFLILSLPVIPLSSGNDTPDHDNGSYDGDHVRGTFLNDALPMKGSSPKEDGD